MNSRERILTALNNREPDKVPIFELLIDESSIVKLALARRDAELTNGLCIEY